jgi:hypothetical protein
MTGTPVRQRELLAVVLITLAFVAAFQALTTTEYIFAGDPDFYVGLARRIAAGQSYAIRGEFEVRFPPGFPAALAPAALVADGSFAAVNRWAAVLAALAFPLTWWYARRRVGWLGVPVALLTVGSLIFLELATGNPYAEPLYLALTMALLGWADRGEETDTTRWSWVLAGAALLVAVPAVRTVGLAAVAAAGLGLVLDVLSRRRRSATEWARRLVPVLAGVLGLVLWFAWTSAHRATGEAGGDRSYLSYLLDIDPLNPDLGRVSPAGLFERLVRNAAVQLAHAGELLAPVTWIKPMWHSPLLVLIPVMAAGLAREFRTGARFGGLYFLGFAGIVVLWPFDERARFLMPLAPLLWIYLIRGIGSAGDAIRADRPWVRRAALLLGVLSLVSVALTNDRSRQDQAAAAFWLGVVALAGPGYALLRGVVAAWQPRHTRLAVGAGVALSLALVLWRSVPGLYRRSHPVPGTFVHPGMDAVAWILANTGPGTAVQASFPNRVAFATDRPAVRLSMSLRPEVHRAIQTRHRPQFAVVLDSIKGDAGASDSARFAVIQRLEPGRWSLVYDFPGGRIYEYR